MTDMHSTPDTAGRFLPDFCSGHAVLNVMAITEVTAILLALAGAVGETQIWMRLLLLSLYLQWIGLTSAAGLCWTRRLWTRESRIAMLGFCYCLLLVITIVISALAYWLAQWSGLKGFAIHSGLDIFAFRSMAICAIVAALTLRYFYVQNQWRHGVRAQAEARFQALQARIRPHFLFNSLNSIAALIHSRPEEAEETVLDLSELFRISLRNPERLVTLDDELSVTRRYLNIESRRLGERLRLDWQLEDGVGAIRVPLLCLQPLIENAVYHGIQMLPGGGTLRVEGRRVAGSRQDEYLHLVVSNPVPEQARSDRGERLALNNIRERLRLIYGERGELRTENRDGTHQVFLTIPVEEAA